MNTTKLPPICPFGSLEDDDAIVLTGPTGATVYVAPLNDQRSHFIRILSNPDTDELTYKIATRADTEADLLDGFAHFKVGPCSLANLGIYGFKEFLAAYHKEKAIA